jgi:Uma2 family endonuclease
LYLLFAEFLRGKPCKVFLAPFDILLPDGEEPDDEIGTGVQPDLLVLCDKGKLRKEGARGAPDIAAEILSPSTSEKDQREKFDLFQRHRVREYWIFDPVGEWMCRYALGADGRFDEGELREPLRAYGSNGSTVLDGFVIEPKELFADMD